MSKKFFLSCGFQKIFLLKIPYWAYLLVARSWRKFWLVKVLFFRFLTSSAQFGPFLKNLQIKKSQKSAWCTRVHAPKISPKKTLHFCGISGNFPLDGRQIAVEILQFTFFRFFFRARYNIFCILLNDFQQYNTLEILQSI